MAPHSSTLAWKIPWTEEPGRLQSVESWGKNLIEVSSKAKGEEELKIACKDD